MRLYFVEIAFNTFSMNCNCILQYRFSDNMAEVSVDAAVSKQVNLTEDITNHLDDIITEVANEFQSHKQIPIDIFIVSQVQKRSELCARTSVVQCFKYVMVNLEKIVSGEDDLSELVENNIECCSLDLAASFMRTNSFIQKHKLGIQEYLDNIQKKKSKSLPEEKDELRQHQSDISYCYAVLRNVNKFRESVSIEVDILIRSGNLTTSFPKIIKYKLFMNGLASLKNVFDLVKLDDFEDLCIKRRTIFEELLHFMDEEDGGYEDEVEQDRCSSNIIVDEKTERGFRNGKFYVNDLESALKLVQNKGGNIFIENGDYHSTTQTFFDVKQKNENTINIVGASTSSCSIHGTIKIQAQSKISFRRIKFEVGESAESKDAMFVTSGHVTFSQCLIEAMVNTLVYVMAGAGVRLEHCVIDGLESCQRCISVTGHACHVVLDTCWVRDMFSVVTVTADDQVSDLSLTIEGCEVDSVQTVVTCKIDTCREITIERNTCNIVLYSEDDPSHVLSLTCQDSSTSSVSITNNYINFQHIDGKAVYLNNIARATVSRCVILTDDKIDRKLSICEAINSNDVDNLILDSVRVTGFRLGVNITTIKDVQIKKCIFDKCSIGVHANVSEKSTKTKLEIIDSEIKTTYYGLLILDTKMLIVLKNNSFSDVPKPLLINKNIVDHVVEDDCQYLLSREFTTSKRYNLLEQEINLHLATSENIAHRTAYSRDDVVLINKFQSLGYS